MKLILLSSCIFLVCQTTARGGLQLPFGRHFDFGNSYPPPTQKIEDVSATGISSDIFNSSEYGTESEGRAQPLLEVENSLSTIGNSSESSTTDDGQSSQNSSSNSSPDAVTTSTLTSTSTAAFGNESQSQNSSQLIISSVPSQDTNSSEMSNVTVSSSATNETKEAEQEGVVRGKPSTTESSIATSQPQSLYQKTWALISDTYTLSILVPVAAGVVFATTIILTIALCNCLRRCCIRRRLRKKVLPDSVKNLRPSDRARLLAESSDDEF